VAHHGRRSYSDVLLSGAWAGGSSIPITWTFANTPTNRVVGAYALAGVAKTAQPFQTAILSSAGTGVSRTLVTGNIDTTIDNNLIIWGLVTNTPATVYTPTSVPGIAPMTAAFDQQLAGQIRRQDITRRCLRPIIRNRLARSLLTACGGFGHFVAAGCDCPNGAVCRGPNGSDRGRDV